MSWAGYKLVNCVCHSIRSMFRVLGIYNFGYRYKQNCLYIFFTVKVFILKKTLLTWIVIMPYQQNFLIVLNGARKLSPAIADCPNAI